MEADGINGRVTITDLRRIRDMSGKGSRELAAMFGVPRSAIQKLLRGSPDRVFAFDPSRVDPRLVGFFRSRAEELRRYESKALRRQEYETFSVIDDSFTEFQGIFTKRL